MWHFVLVVLWAVAVGMAWNAYYDRSLGIEMREGVLLATGLFGILSLLLWTGTFVMGCAGFCCGGRVGTKREGWELGE